MQTLSFLSRQPLAAGQRLPTVFRKWAQDGLYLRAGLVAMLAGTPGSMKTQLGLYLVHKMGLPTLYFSADTNPPTMLNRSGAMLTGETQAAVETGLHTEDADYYTSHLGQLDHIKWVFNSDPTYADLELEAAAFAEVHGEHPAVIVVDNLMNVVGENEDEWGSMRDTTKALHRLTRITGACVLVMHHMGEKRADNSYPSPRSDIQGKVAQLPELILSLGYDGVSELKVARVKDRNGKADASGRTYTSLFVDAARVQFYETPYDLKANRVAAA